MSLMPSTPPTDPREAQRWRRQNIIDYPHIVTYYVHLRNTMFKKEILEKGMKVKEFWCRYEWKHHGSPHVHGFSWLEGAPNMDTINWSNEDE